mmetsp:Transcript_124521/g.311366  ORF Transcript_124521/g.311366 Transcript_124521/m.311366 type:complete len:827 (+) Transcript_124521:82-2562(+)
MLSGCHTPSQSDRSEMVVGGNGTSDDLDPKTLRDILAQQNAHQQKMQESLVHAVEKLVEAQRRSPSPRKEMPAKAQDDPTILQQVLAQQNAHQKEMQQMFFAATMGNRLSPEACTKKPTPIVRTHPAIDDDSVSAENDQASVHDEIHYHQPGAPAPAWMSGTSAGSDSLDKVFIKELLAQQNKHQKDMQTAFIEAMERNRGYPCSPSNRASTCESPQQSKPRKLAGFTPKVKIDNSQALSHAKATGQHKVFSWLDWAPPPNSPCYETLHKCFPGALPGQAVHARVRSFLEEERWGFTPENTLFGSSICPDEINNEKGDLVDIMKEFWGECFPLGGIGGAPFVGKTGFKAFSHHVPEDGNIIMLFGPHVAISESGEVGKYLRQGQSSHSTACGACIGAYKACLEKAEKNEDDSDDDEFDECDMQMAWIKSQLEPHVGFIKRQDNPMAALAYQSYEAVKAKTLKIVNTEFGSGNLVLVGGIQINMPAPYEDHFVPLMFEMRRGGEPNVDLMEEWYMRVPRNALDPDASSRTEADMKQEEDQDVALSPNSAKRRQLVNSSKMQHVVFSWLRWAPSLDSPVYAVLHKFFPGALPGRAIHARMRSVLEAQPFGFTAENTIIGTSVCPDEINNEKGDLTDLLKEHWGACFPLGGISGTPFVGKTGFKAFSHHVPDDGNVCVLFGPHVAISETGEIGKYLREGQANHSTACGAVIGAYCACAASAIAPTVAASEFDEHDMQMAWIKKQIHPHVEHIGAQESPMAALAHQSYEMVKSSVLQIVDTSFGCGYLAIVGGVQINMPPPFDDHFLPCMFEVRRRDQAAQDLQWTFTAF